ncbi:septum site-determining protein MinC [Peribacillus alkalitolerans]|uniref:septum site-determining protein MinC n=1 Tax=Peribacillus alkalitolerans TaxID=1550385 RepID=UPI0013D8654A|nr:septum site-determining protein MinC [Peribacillus alkalitolerans]
MRSSQTVMIKGTKEGLTLHLDDHCSFFEIKRDLEEKLSAKYKFQKHDPHISVRVHTGNRLLTPEQEEEIKSVIQQKEKLIIEDFDSNVIPFEEAKRWKEESSIETIASIVRSGQVLEVKGDLLLIGDVNPGGTVKAGGNIFIIGMLKGAAHAGCNGNAESVIAASVMKASQLRIAESVSLMQDDSQEASYEMQCAYLSEKNDIVIDKLQVLKKVRPILNRLEGGL